LNFKDNRTLADWFWEYTGCYEDSSVFAIVKEKDRVIGTQGFIPIYLNIGNRRFLSAKSENSLLSSEYRQGNLFRELYDFGLEKCRKCGMCLVWGLTPAFKVWKEKLGFSVHTEVKFTSVLILRPLRFLDKILKSRRGVSEKILLSSSVFPLYVNSLLKKWLKSLFKGKETNFVVQERPNSFEDIQDLYTRLKSSDNLIHIDYDEKYLSWRVFNNPNVKYRTWFAYEGNLLKAYCYLSISKEDAYLSDFTFENWEAGDALLRVILNELSSSNHSSIMFTGNVKNSKINQIFALLKKYGFVGRKDAEAFVILNLSAENDKYLYDIKNWYINGLWTEGYTW
jgi:hypothetical protein